MDEPTQSMLVGLSTVHALTLALDDRERLRWISDRLGLLGGRESEFIGRYAADLSEGLVLPDDVETRRHRVQEFVETITSAEPVCRARIAVGLLQEEIEMSSFYVVDAAGEQFRIIVSEWANAPDATGKAYKRALETKNDELETCVRSVSHDLRSPLVSVLGFTRLLRDEFGDPIGRTGRHFLDRIEQAGRNMERLLHDMIELSRLDETPYFPVSVDPSPVLKELAAELNLQLDEAGIDLNLPTDPPLVVCDRTRLYQLFSNLIGNAIRHMEPNASGRIDVSVEVVPDGWEISVKDNGPGIAPEDSKRIFEPFQTARRPGEPKKSSGLGLAIVRKIVEAHRGRIVVESELGAGARFVVWLPRS